MVGLGDRHVQNILIDTNTAEFIHIDLGKQHSITCDRSIPQVAVHIHRVEIML